MSFDRTNWKITKGDQIAWARVVAVAMCDADAAPPGYVDACELTLDTGARISIAISVLEATRRMHDHYRERERER